MNFTINPYCWYCPNCHSSPCTCDTVGYSYPHYVDYDKIREIVKEEVLNTGYREGMTDAEYVELHEKAKKYDALVEKILEKK